MGSITDLSDLVSLCSGGGSASPQFYQGHKNGRVAGAAAPNPVAGRFTSLWQYEGSISHGAAPTTIANPTNATAGSWAQTNPGGGRQLWATYAGGVSTAVGTIVVYDRLQHIGNLDGTLTTAQTVGGSLTRFTSGLGVEAFVEIYTQIGVTSTTISGSYTNELGTSGRTFTATPIGNAGLREAQRMIPLSLAAGDRGVQSVQNVQLAATTGTAGAFGITLARRLFAIPVTSVGLGAARTFVDGPMVEVVANACLAFMWFPQTTTVAEFDMSLFLVEK